MQPDSRKSALRAAFRLKRNAYVDAMTSTDKAVAFSRMPAPLATHCTGGVVVAGYVAVGSEADPMRLLEQAADMGCITALPHVISRVAPMRFLSWKPGDPLVAGPFGLMQPDDGRPMVDPEVVLVPLIAFDDAMMRLGQGAGHYDRALSLLDHATAIGIAWSVQQSDNLPADPWDIPLDAILTEKSWISR